MGTASPGFPTVPGTRQVVALIFRPHVAYITSSLLDCSKHVPVKFMKKKEINYHPLPLIIRGQSR